MTEQQIHEIAVAYAQIKLRAYQEEHKDVIDYNPLSCDSKAKRYALAKWYISLESQDNGL